MHRGSAFISEKWSLFALSASTTDARWAIQVLYPHRLSILEPFFNYFPLPFFFSLYLLSCHLLWRPTFTAVIAWPSMLLSLFWFEIIKTLYYVYFYLLVNGADIFFIEWRYFWFSGKRVKMVVAYHLERWWLIARFDWVLVKRIGCWVKGLVLYTGEEWKCLLSLLCLPLHFQIFISCLKHFAYIWAWWSATIQIFDCSLIA